MEIEKEQIQEGQVWAYLGVVEEKGKDIENSNSFEALSKQNEKQEASITQQNKQSTKEWVNKTFGKTQKKAAEEQSQRQTKVDHNNTKNEKQVEELAEQS